MFKILKTIGSDLLAENMNKAVLAMNWDALGASFRQSAILVLIESGSHSQPKAFQPNIGVQDRFTSCYLQDTNKKMVRNLPMFSKTVELHH